MSEDANPENARKNDDEVSAKKMSENYPKNIQFECLWGYEQPTRFDNGIWHFEPAICEPKSRDNELKTETILRACRICPIALKNLRLLKAKSGKLTDLAKSVNRALPSRKYQCDARGCDFETFDLEEARRHQDMAGYEHFFAER